MYSITAVNEITNKVRKKSNVLYRVIFPVQKGQGRVEEKAFLLPLQRKKVAGRILETFISNQKCDVS